MNYLRALSAEMRREYIEFKRYPLEVVFSAFFFALMFCIVYLLASGLVKDVGIDLSNPKIQHNISNLFVGYIVWIFTFFIVGVIPQSISSDVSSGLLEQILLSPLHSGVLILFRSLAQAVWSVFPVVLTGGFIAIVVKTSLSFDYLTLLVCLALLSLGSIGLGMFMGGVVLVFKKAAMLNVMLTWATSLLVAVDYNQVGVMGFLVKIFPISQGIKLFRMSIVDGMSLSQMLYSGDLLYMIIGSLIFLTLGVFSFGYFDKIARKYALLSQY